MISKKLVSFVRVILAINIVAAAAISVAQADIKGYWTDQSGKVLRNSAGQCYHTQAWEIKDAIAACEPANIVDTDKDGVTNNIDACPGNIAGVEVDARGCELDNDKDGLVNRLDACPNTLAGAEVDATGCAVAIIDSDGDGIADSSDSCPSSATDAIVDANGCEHDSDGDKIVDSQDRCAETPPGATVDAQGCELDSDGDGIADSRDQCFNTASGLKVGPNGCKLLETLTMKGVHFETNSDSLTDESAQALDEVAKTLKHHPEMIVEVGGYTDNTGSKSLNEALSQKRAQSVANYLTSKGAPVESLQVKGYGTESPIADNGTATGRYQNRRVELRVIQQPSAQEFQFVFEP